MLAAQGRGETVIEPRVHLFPGGGADGHFNVLRGALPLAAVAGVKVVGDYVGNHARGLPSELALLTLYDASTGAPTAILDATAITAMRTGAVTAVGARHLARADSRVLAHIGSRGTAEWNVRLLCAVLPGLEEVRIHSRTADEPGQRSPRGSTPSSTSPCAPSTAGRSASAAPTSSSRRRGSSRPSRCCAPSGSRRARWSSPTAR